MVIVVSIVLSTIGAIAVGASSMALFSNNAQATATTTGILLLHQRALLLMRPKISQLKVMTALQGYFTVIKHVYNDPNLRVSLFCKPGVKIVGYMSDIR